MWRLYVKAVEATAARIAPHGATLIFHPRRAARAVTASCILWLSSFVPLAFPQAVSPQEFERLKSTVEYHDKRIDSIDGKLSAAQTDITAIRLALQKVDQMDSLLKLIAGLFFPLAGSAVLFAYKAGRWTAKADGHISGEHEKVKA